MADVGETKPKLSQSVIPDEKPKIQVIVEYQGRTATFAVRKHTRFEKIFKSAEGQFQVQANTLRFLFDGERLQPEETPADVGMEDGDKIDAMVEQLGGC